MAKARRRRRVIHRANRRRRRRNPSLSLAPRRHHRRHHLMGRRRHRRNPRSRLRDVGLQRWVVGGLWATGGAIFARALPGYVASSYNNGIVGYALNFASAIGASFLASFFGSDAAFAAGIGGVSATFLRMIQDYGGGNIPGVSGDIDHMGFFTQGDMAIPAMDSGKWLPTGRPMLSVSNMGAPVVVTPAAAALPAGHPAAKAAASGAAAAPSSAATLNAAMSGSGSWRSGGRWS